ncbi:MAG TPA: Lrp/AsnC family transcriptional regulator [Candidatus Binataceae bacterium]|nr:Lrp/AsnC family transcriptional regulator [Candidatus Binataceae bacterium]
MKLGLNAELDAIDLQILSMLQEHCKTPLAKLGEQVGLSAPSVIERIKKLEDSGIITGYHATVDARRLGKDVTAFIGVSISHPKLIGRFETTVAEMDDVLECHHVTGEHSLLLKVKTDDTAALESLISTIRFIEGVSRTETMVVLSTHTERVTVALPLSEGGEGGSSRRPRHPGPRVGLPPKRA